jgi:general secretion pathway protein G
VNVPTRRRFRSGSHGLTLVELLVVMGIVAVLAAIAVPAYARYQDRIRSQQAVTEIGELALRITLHARDTRDLPASLAEVGADGKLDPWGRPYVYYNVEANGRGHARKDHALNPINTDFDLYSIGPDGASKPQISQKQSVDDLIRAGNGRFVGIAADF